MSKRPKENLSDVINQLITGFVGVDVEHFDKVMNNALQRIGVFFNADRVYVFEYDLHGMKCSNTHEWCAKGIEAMIDTLQDVSLVGLKHWVENHVEGKETYIPNVFDLDKDNQVRKILEPQKILSLLTIPLMINKTCYGFLGIDSVKEYRNYSNEEVETLIKFGEILTLFQQKQISEKELIETQSFLKSVLNNQKEYVCRIDQKTNHLVYANQSFFEDISPLYNLSLGDDLFKSELFSIVHVHEILSFYSNQRKKLVFEQEIHDQNNNAHMIMWEAYHLEQEDEIQFVGFNISTLKKSIDDSDDLKQKLNHNLDATNTGTWQYNVKEKRLIVDDLFAQTLGYEKEVINNFNTHELSKLFNTKDIQKVLNVVHDIKQNKATRFDVNLRMLHKNGSTLTFNEFGYTKNKEYTNQTLHVIGFHRNITKELELEMDIRSMKHIFDVFDKMVVITDVNNVIKYVNNAFVFITGYSSVDVIGKKTNILKSNEQSVEFYTNMHATLVKNETWQGNLINKDKQGDFYHCKVIISPITDNEGNIVRFVAVYDVAH